MPALLLASSSPYRRELLDRLQLPFTWQSPSIDETRLAGETGIDLVRRLAEAKARALADQHPGHRDEPEHHCVDYGGPLDARFVPAPEHRVHTWGGDEHAVRICP